MPVQPPGDETWHPMVKGYYLALADSGQSRFFEPSDWAHAYLMMEATDRLLKKDFSASLLNTIMSGMTELGTTVGARRRMGLDLFRKEPGEGEQPPEVAAMDAYRAAAKRRASAA